jgi:O-antigen chain-terminating methyltransferase
MTAPTSAAQDAPALRTLQARVQAEEGAYEELLAALDRASAFALPLERRPDLTALMQALNSACTLPQPSPGTGPLARLDARVQRLLAPAWEQQQRFNGLVVQVLNAHVDESARLHGHLRDCLAALVRYAQRLLPVIDARDRLASALTGARAELVLEAFDRRQESLARRLEGLLAQRDRLAALGAEVDALRSTLAGGTPAPELAAAAVVAAQDAQYVGFEQRFRAPGPELERKLAAYVPHFVERAPVADLGCGRGEFLAHLRAAGIAALGVDGNAGFVQACVAQGLDVRHGDLLAFLRQRPEASLGGLFSAQVAEHLPPPVLVAMLREAQRVLRPGGLLLLETVNPRSLVGLLEVYNRDLTHERPLHPDTLAYLAAAAGFGEVRVQFTSPVDPLAQLQPVPAEGLPEPAAATLNENVARLNALIYGPQEYVLLAWR